MRLASARLGPFIWGGLLSLALLAPLGCNNDTSGVTQCPPGGICTTDNPDLAAKNFAEGWNHIILKSLPAYIEGKSA